MVKALCGRKLQCIQISLWAESSLRRAISGHKDFHAEDIMDMIFFPMDDSTLKAGVLHTPACWDTEQKHHLTALPCTGHICREGFAFLLVPRSLCGSCDAQ